MRSVIPSCSENPDYRCRFLLVELLGKKVQHLCKQLLFFIDHCRLQMLLNKLAIAHTPFKPARAERIGVRYVNRFKGEDLTRVRDYIRPEVLGVLFSDIGTNLKHSVPETFIEHEEKGLNILARWGLLGTGLSHDPAAVPPVNEQSWILDIDAFPESKEDFEPEALINRLSKLADIYKNNRLSSGHSAMVSQQARAAFYCIQRVPRQGQFPWVAPDIRKALKSL